MHAFFSTIGFSLSLHLRNFIIPVTVDPCMSIHFFRDYVCLYLPICPHNIHHTKKTVDWILSTIRMEAVHCQKCVGYCCGPHRLSSRVVRVGFIFIHAKIPLGLVQQYLLENLSFLPHVFSVLSVRIFCIL
jgi:hypothetical protein